MRGSAAQGHPVALRGARGSGRSRYDTGAPAFDRHRALPQGVADAVRAAVLRAVGAGQHPRLLDLGAGTGRIGCAFVAAGDDYIGVDLSLGMLREFARRAESGQAPRLVQADGCALPFPDAAFDGVMLIQVFGGLDDWLSFAEEARRVLRKDGALILGRTVAPEEGVDARMKSKLACLHEERGIARKQANAREEVEQWLSGRAADARRITVATWKALRTPRAFLERHRTGARFSALLERVKEDALARLEEWAQTEFGSLDASFEEPHEFELRVFRF